MFSSSFFTMFCSSRVLLMNFFICFGFGKIWKYITPCIARTFSRIGCHTTLKTTANTLNALKIVPRHVKLHWRKPWAQFLREIHKLWGFECSSKKKYVAKGKKTIPQEIVELLKDMTMVDYQVTTSNKDFNDLFERTDMRHFSRCLDLLPKSCCPYLFWPNFFSKV